MNKYDEMQIEEPNSPGGNKDKTAAPSSPSEIFSGRLRSGENLNYSDPVKHTGTLSKSLNHTALKVATVAVKGGHTSAGVVTGTDPHRYLGHFRSPEVMKRGHNQGAPGDPVTGGATSPAPTPSPAPAPTPQALPTTKVAPVFSAAANPVRAQRQAGRAAMKATPAGGGARKEQRVENRAAMVGARKAAKAIPAGERRATAHAAINAARTENKAITGAAHAAKKADRIEDRTARKTAVGGARDTFKAAKGAVHEAKKTERKAIRSGDVAGAGAGFKGIQAAKAARGAARKGLGAAKRAKY